MPPVTVPQAFALAVQHHQAGRLAEAEALYRQILATQPNHPGAVQYLGVVYHQAGRDDLAIEWLQRATTLTPNNAAAHSNLGEAYRTSGRFGEAIVAFRQALELDANFPDAHNNLGIALAAQNRTEEAIACYRRAIELRPAFAEAENNLGSALAALGLTEEAMASYQRALAVKPGYAEPHYNLGIALMARGRCDEAIASHRRALQIKPLYAEAQYNLGFALRERGEVAEAIAAYRRALEIRPGWAEAHNNLGQVLTDTRQLHEAVPELRRALELKADYADAWYNLGIALHLQGQLDDAAAAYRRALQIRPEETDAHNNLGNVLKDQGDLDGAIAAYRRASDLQPNDPGYSSNVIFALHFHPDNDGGAIAAEYTRWNRQFSDPVKSSIRSHSNDRDPERRLRIGYVSPDFRDHSLGWYVHPLFRCHNHRNFEIMCYSGVSRPDGVTGELRNHADHWRNTVGVPDEEMAAMIRQDGIDILVDLAQHTGGNRLPVFARQPAPVQVSFAGYPESAGVDAIGYRISDRWLEGNAECGMRNAESEASSEFRVPERVFLIDTFWCHDPLGIEIAVTPLPARENGHVTFGCLNNFCKVNEDVLRLWARVLGEVRDSRLMLLSAFGSHRERVLEFLGRAGVAGDRVEFVTPRPRKTYLEWYHRLDVVLDTFPYSGHMTNLDASWMGLPVVTLPGPTAVSRGGLSVLNNLGLPELVASSADDYVRIAAKLASDLPRLADLRASLRGRLENSVLMDAAHFTRQIEAAYREMWQQWTQTAK